MEEKLGFKPLGARVLVEKYKPETKEKEKVSVSEGVSIAVDKLEERGGLLLPVKQEEDVSEVFLLNSGKVLALGTNLSEDALNNVKVGDTITFQNPHLVNYKGTEYYLIHENNINLIVED